MPTKIFVNLPVKYLKKTMDFSHGKFYTWMKQNFQLHKVSIT